MRRAVSFQPFPAALFDAALIAGKFRLRKILGRVIRFRLRGLSRDWPARARRATLVVAPHPDDEVFGCGGLIAHRIANGEEVQVVFITDGAASHPGHPRVSSTMIASLRADEARASTAILGVPAPRLVFLNAPDGQLPHLDASTRERLVRDMGELIQRLAPDEIFVTSRHDGSTEHVAASALVRAALTDVSPRPRLLEYIVWSRWNPRLLKGALRSGATIYRHGLSARELSLKQNAIQAYRSQIAPLSPWEHPALPARFAEMFSEPEEFFFEF